MKLRSILGLAAVLAAGSVAAYAGPTPACTAGALAGVYTNADGTSNGFSCEIGDSVYSNFVYITAGADPDAAQINVGIDNNTGIMQTGLQINSAVAGLTWQTSGFSLSYTVTVDPSACSVLFGTSETCSIAGAQGQFQGAFFSNAASMTMGFTPGGSINLNGVTPGNTISNLDLSNQPLTSTNVVISGVTAGRSDPIDSFGLDLYQVVTPEPATLGLVGAGLLGLAFLKRRRASAGK